MRITSIVIVFFTLATDSTGFAPRAAAPVIQSIAYSVYSAVFYESADMLSTSSHSAFLSLFSSTAKTARKFNAPAKSEGAVTEEHVRALFKL